VRDLKQAQKGDSYRFQKSLELNLDNKNAAEKIKCFKQKNIAETTT